METAEFFREKANQCRALASSPESAHVIARGLLALALELDARAVAIEAGQAAAREIESNDGVHPDGDGGRS